MSRKNDLLPAGTCDHLCSMDRQALKIQKVDVFSSEMNQQYDYVGVLHPVDSGVVVYFQHDDIRDVFIPEEHFMIIASLLDEPVGCCSASARREVLESLPGCSFRKVEPENCPIYHLDKE